MKATLLILVLFVLSLPLQARDKIESGITVNAGAGSISAKPTSLLPGETYSVENKFNFSFGYRFRLPSKIYHSLFLDLDAYVGIKGWKSAYGESLIYCTKKEVSSQYYFLSASATINYPIYKGLSIGVGGEPVCYFYKEGEDSNNNFGVAAIGKIAYDFKILEIGLSYKHGLNTMTTDYLKSFRFKDWQFSVWVPF